MKKNSSINLCILFHYVVVSIFVTTATFADTLPDSSSSNGWEKVSSSNVWEKASAEELTDVISQTTIQIKEYAREASVIKETVEFAWTNPDFTSDSIIAKRQALKQAEAAFIQARIALQEEMYRLPEIQKLSEENKALLNKIEALRNKNTELINLLKIRRKAPPSND